MLIFFFYVSSLIVFQSYLTRYRTPKVEKKFVEKDDDISNRIDNANLTRLATDYRIHGHKRATINPLKGLANTQSE